MRGKDLFEAITGLDDGLVAGPAEDKPGKKPGRGRWLAAAACFAAVLSAAFFFGRGRPAEGPRLPMLAIEEGDADAMGYEGYLAYDITDLISANPWNENALITHLPVIKNKRTYNGIQRVENPDYPRMERLLKETAESLGMDVENIPLTNDIPDGETQKMIAEKMGGQVPEGYFDIGRLILEDDRYRVEADTACTVEVNFKTPVRLPEGYRFEHHSGYEDALRAAEYIKKEYAELIGMKDPVTCVAGGDFNIYGEQSYSISFYERGKDLTQDILNYHFDTVCFYPDDDGALFLVRKNGMDLSEVVGEYPVISPKEALALLEGGNYATTVPYPFKSKEHVKKAELVYRVGAWEKLFMPYYRFYVELPDEKLENGLKDYGAYYVPAVEGKYIENMPVWDGGFG